MVAYNSVAGFITLIIQFISKKHVHVYRDEKTILLCILPQVLTAMKEQTRRRKGTTVWKYRSFAQSL